MKLNTITFKAIPKMPGMRPGDLITIDTAKPGDGLKDWRVSIRGQQVFFISPSGWVSDRSVKQRDAKGPITVFEIPRAEVIFGWSGPSDELEAILKGGKYDSEPFGFVPTPVVSDRPILDQVVPPGQMGDA